MKYDGFEIPDNKSDSSLSPVAKAVLVILGIVLLLVAGTLVGKRSRTDQGGTTSPPVQTAPAPVQTAQQLPKVDFSVASVTLDFKKREMAIRGILTNNGSTRPERVWVWAYYFVPNSIHASGSWSDSPLLIENPFDDGNVKDVTARGYFHWADNQNAPKNGYFARVSYSAISADAAKVSSELRDKSPHGAKMVNVIW